ncbi:Uncharacterised protein [Mycobacteroides abscessus subsp. abscessus]|nr:Uncharacterised protein [Mycobacteroides abscessus subsp. abscessus]
MKSHFLLLMKKITLMMRIMILIQTSLRKKRQILNLIMTQMKTGSKKG